MKRQWRVAVVPLLLLPALASAHLDSWDWDGKGIRPSIPPSLHRPAIGARVLGPGQGRSGVHADLLRTRDSGRSNVYPYDENNVLTAFGAGTRWGLSPGGAEIGGALDYPFFLPSAFVRYQPFGRDWEMGPWFTLEAGASFMPDFHGGAALGVGIGPLLELWGDYRGGWVLDRGYSEVGAGATLHAARTMDLGGGFSVRRYDTEPYEQTSLLSLRVEFGNAGDPLRGDAATGGLSAQALLEAGKFKAAAQAYEDELEVFPKDATRWKGYAAALEELGLTRKARRARKRALQLGLEGGDPGK